MTMPENPIGESLAAADARFDAGDGQFVAIEGGQIRCLTCRSTFAADSLAGDRAARVEGVSDPADMSVVIPARCPVCDATGTLIVRYGPEASAEEAEVLLSLDRHPTSASVDAMVRDAAEHPTPLDEG